MELSVNIKIHGRYQILKKELHRLNPNDNWRLIMSRNFTNSTSKQKKIICISQVSKAWGVLHGSKHIIFEWHNPDIAVQIIWCWWLNVANGIIIALQFMSENFLKDRYKHKQNNSIKISWRKMCNAQTKTSKCYREICLKLSTDYAHWNHDKGIMCIVLVNIPLIYLWLV